MLSRHQPTGKTVPPQSFDGLDYRRAVELQRDFVYPKPHYGQSRLPRRGNSIRSRPHSPVCKRLDVRQAWPTQSRLGLLERRRIERGRSAAARTVPTLFNLQTTKFANSNGAMPDMLWIDWGSTPVGSVASIYWPQASADTVLQLASLISPVKALTKVDQNTVQCTTGSITLVPIPPGTSPESRGSYYR